MYRIVKTKAGENVRHGPMFLISRRDRAEAFLAKYCLNSDGAFYPREKGPAFLEEYAPWNQENYDGQMQVDPDPDHPFDAEKSTYRMVDDAWQVIWDPPPEVNEFGRVSP